MQQLGTMTMNPLPIEKQKMILIIFLPYLHNNLKITVVKQITIITIYHYYINNHYSME